jgi:hypothetical protein
MYVIENDKTFFDFGGNRVLLLRQRNGSLNLAALNNWYLDAGPSAMLTSWTHLVAVFTGSQLQIYRDGFLVSSCAATPANFNLFANMKLGVMNGAVQSARFYNTGFSADAVRDLYLWGRYGVSATQIALPDPLESWRQGHFGITTDTGVAANDFDQDGDGLVNLMEYALGGNPTAAHDAPRPMMAMAEGPPQMLHYSFNRLRSDLTYIVEGSPDLKSWEPVDTNSGNVGETVTVETPTTGDHRFLRLRVVSVSITPEIR